MAERPAPPERDLVAGLRRVDDAFAGLKTGRDDVVERLLAGDTDELVRQSERRQRGARVRKAATVAGTFALALATVVAVRLLPAADGSTVAHAPTPAAPTVTTPTTTATTTPATTTPATTTPAAPAIVATTPTIVPTTPVLVTAPTPPLRRLPGRRPGLEAPGSFAGLDARDDLQPLPTADAPTLAGTTRPLALDAVGIAAPVAVAPGDADVDTALRAARRLAARGDLTEATAVLGQLLERGPEARVVDVVLVERARLLHRAGQVADACAALQTHRDRFPASDNAAIVDAERARWSCP